MEEEVKVDFEEEKAVVITVPPIKVEYGSVEVDFSDFKKNVAKRVAFFKTLTLTDDNVKVIEKARADLNRTAKQLNDYRISVEKDFNKPFDEFKSNVKDVCTLLLDASKVLDDQLKEYEKCILDLKVEKIRCMFNELDKPTFIKFEHIYNPKWDNKGFTLDKVKKDLEYVLLKVKEDNEAIIKMAVNEEHVHDIKAHYYTSDLTYDSIVNGTKRASVILWYKEFIEQREQIKQASVIEKQSESSQPSKVDTVEEKRINIVIELKNISKGEAIKLDNFLRENKYNYKILN